jgi:S-adenosylmethionine:tRNA ribosyltransferase-isomerase
VFLSDFDFHLPENLIAQIPLEKRDSSKLFFFDKKNNLKQHKNIFDLIDLVDKNSVLVFNKSRVIPARITFFNENNPRITNKQKEEKELEILLSKKIVNND